MHYTVQLYFTCTIRTRAQSVRRQQEKRTSDESEMVTYNHDTAVVRSKCVNHQAMILDSRVLLLIIEVKINFSLGFDDTDYQTNKL